MVLTLAMSFAVTSSIVWWFFRPLIAANMLRIIGASLLLEDLGDRGGIDAVGPPDGEGRLAVGARHAIHLAGMGLVVLAEVRDGAPDEAHRPVECEVVGHRRVGVGHV